MDQHTDVDKYGGKESHVDRDDLEVNCLDAKGDANSDTGKVKRDAGCDNDGDIEIEDLNEPYIGDHKTEEWDSCNKTSKYYKSRGHDLKMNGSKAGDDDVDDNSTSENDKERIHAKPDKGPGLGLMNETGQSADSDSSDSMQFSSVVENIYFLDEEELKLEHETDKQKNALLTNLGSDKYSVDKLNIDQNLVINKGDIPFLDETVEYITRGSDCQDSDLTENPFSYLPDELIVKIFSYLNTEQLSRHAMPVCQKWRQIAKEPSLWRKVDFHCCPQLESLSLLWVLRKTPLLRKLVLRGRTNITHAEVAILSEMCPLLNDIDFGFCDNLNGDMIRTLVDNCKELRKLNVEGCDKIDHKAVQCLSKSKKLSCLNFSHCFLQDDSLIHLAENLSQIISLNLDGISWITDMGVSSLVSKHYDHLVDLVLDGAEISDAAIRNITRCKKLETLELSFCECLSDDALVFLKDLDNLRELKLRKGSSFTKEGMSSFFKTVKLPHLQGLNLSECTCIDDSVVLDIVQCCGSHLTFLSLCWCWFITDMGLVSIVDHCGKLESLELLGIDKITGSSLSRVPEEIPNLTFLDLRQCNKIVDQLIVDVIRKKADLKVFNYYGEEFVHQ